MSVPSHRAVRFAGAAFGAFVMALGVGSAQAADTCPNAAFRTGASAGLPDCRAYELVSPDSNHAAGGVGNEAGLSSADGKTFAYQTIDAPDNAQSAGLFNIIRATRNAATGWSGVSMSPPQPTPSTVFQGGWTEAFSIDLTSTVEFTDQPLSGGSPPPGGNIYVRRPDGSYQLASNVGYPILPFIDIHNWPQVSWGDSNFSHVYVRSDLAQVPGTPSNNVYVWSADRGMRVASIISGTTPAPNGAYLALGMLQPASEGGKYVVFGADGELYLRIDDAQTVDLGAVVQDPTTPLTTDQAGITADGGKVFFTSRTELTGDANTGPANQGRDLYSYDTGAGQLTDETPDPVDPNGADVQKVVAATKDGSYVYFTATGALANGATAGQSSLYVLHDGDIDLVKAGISVDSMYLTPDGQHGAVASTTSLTGYDNTDPVTGDPHVELFKFGLESGFECASCRVDGTQPTQDTVVSTYNGRQPGRAPRVTSDDGSRVFFQSKDAVLPGATNGHRKIYQYADGKVTALSPLDSVSEATFLDASTSGGDVFFNTYDALVPNPNNGDYAVVDARIGGGFPGEAPRCTAVACQSPVTSAPALPTAASLTILPDGNLPAEPDGSGDAPKVTVSKISTINGTSGLLKVKVPGKGRLAVSGSGLQTKRSNPTKAQTISVRLSLTSAAVKSLKKHRSFKTKVKVSFVNGSVTTTTLTVTFKLATSRKGR